VHHKEEHYESKDKESRASVVDLLAPSTGQVSPLDGDNNNEDKHYHVHFAKKLRQVLMCLASLTVQRREKR
jgi:hypothetical protein